MPLTKGSGQYIFFRRKQNERSLFLECFRRNADNQRKGTIHIIVGGKEMRLQENIKNRKMMHHDDTAGHGHDHEHNHEHDDCCEDGVEIEKNKTIAGVAVFLVAFVVFHIPGLFKSFSDTTMENIELVVFLLIYLVTARDIVLNAIKNLFKGKALDEQFLMSVASLGAFIVGEYPEACAVMIVLHGWGIVSGLCSR